MKYLQRMNHVQLLSPFLMLLATINLSIYFNLQIKVTSLKSLNMLLTIYQIWQGLKKEYNIICLQFYVNWLRNKALNPRIRLRYKILSHIENNAPLIHKTQRKKELKQTVPEVFLCCFSRKHSSFVIFPWLCDVDAEKKAASTFGYFFFLRADNN